MAIDKIDKTKNKLSINFTEQKITDMILNFLGKKQTLSFNTNDENFEIRRNDVEQFYFLFDEKIRKEHYTTINYFSVSIEYNDKTRRDIVGIDALTSFLETRDVYSRNITMTWNIILDFPNSQTIENQKIEISFDSMTDEILLSVEHTNQAWGIEVLNLFKDHIQSLVKHKPKKLKYAEQIGEVLGSIRLLTVFLFFQMTFMLAYLTTNIIDKKNKDIEQAHTMAKIIKIGINEQNIMETLLSLYTLEKNNNIPDVLVSLQSKEFNKEINKYINKTDTHITLWDRAYNIILSIFVICLGIALYLWQITKYHGMKSFILMTGKGEKKYESFHKNKNKLLYFSISAIVMSVSCSVIGNIIYQVVRTQ